MNFELVLGKKLNIRAYPQYAFLDAIMNNDITNSEKICSLYVYDDIKFKWNFQHLNAAVDNINGNIQIYRKGYGIHQTGGFYCNCDNFDEIIFCINYMQYTNVWNNVSFFYSQDDAVSFLDNAFYDYHFCYFCCGDWRVDINETNVYYKNNMFERETPRWYKIKKQNNTIKLYFSHNGKKWKEINSTVLYSTRTENVKVGFCIHLYENQYQKWLCNNYIQLKFNKNDGKKIDYVGFMNRDYVNYAINPLIKFSYDKREIIKKRGLWNYIKDNIYNKRYLEIWLNEYYIEGTKAFKKHFYNHESLIYGIDEKKKKISIMSFINGKPTFISTSFRAVEKAWNEANNNNMIYVFEFFPDIGGYNIDIKHIRNLLQDYIEGKNSTENYRYIAEENGGVFGHKIYNEIMSDDFNQELFINDVRIAFLIKEHKECMLFRIKFLYEYGALSEKNYSHIIELMTSIVNKSGVIMNLVLKNRALESYIIKERIWKYIKELSDLEEICYQSVIQDLNEYLRQ